MKYKVGDRVKIKSLDWYNENKDEDDNVVCFYSYFDKGMSEFCNKIVTIKSLHGCHNVKAFRIIEDDGYSWWSDDMIEGLVEEENNDCEKCGLTCNSTRCLFMDNCPHNKQKNIIEIPEDCVIKDENGNVINATKIVLEKKKKEYPKTYEECCKVLGIPIHGGIALVGNWCMEDGYIAQHLETLRTLSKLLICRDAYWKIAGNEMGLGKPWKPIDNSEVCYGIFNWAGKIQHDTTAKWCILTFPTAEMRDAFKENFKEEIEICKELL